MVLAPRSSSSTPGWGSVPRYSCTATSAAVPAVAAICWLTITRNGATSGRATGAGWAGLAGAAAAGGGGAGGGGGGAGGGGGGGGGGALGRAAVRVRRH